MRALTIRQPWAALLAHRQKAFETRSFKVSYRGPVALHASANADDLDLDLLASDPFRSVLERLQLARFDDAEKTMRITGLTFGAIVAVGRLEGCFKTAASRETVRARAAQGRVPKHEIAFGDWRDGRFAWLLNDVRILREPIPARGQLGLWKLDPLLQAKVRAAVADAGAR